MKKVIIKIVFLTIVFSVPFLMVHKNVLEIPKGEYNKVLHFDKESFILGISEAEKDGGELEYKVRGGVVPHHLLASSIIADFFKKLSQNPPETIILLGPNHLETGDFKALTNSKSWMTEYGVVRPDPEILSILLKKNLVKIDDKAVEEDQSISSPMTFVAFYLPSTKVVPIILSADMKEEDISKLSEEISKIIKSKNAILVSSIDFSHYLSFDQAEARDLESITAIKNFGCSKIIKFDSDNMDSAPAMCTLLYTMLSLGSTNIDIQTHENSYNIQKSGSDSTTSYFSIFFH